MLASAGPRPGTRVSAVAWWALGEGQGRGPEKAATLDRLRAAGLPVPPGVVVPLDPRALDDPGVRAAVEELLAAGPVIVRGALAGEDAAERSAAGLGRSIAGARSIAAARAALAAIAEAAASDPWLGRYGGLLGAGAAIVQAQVAGRVLAVVAAEGRWPAAVEAFSYDPEALSIGSSPIAAGALDAWADPAAPALLALLPQLRAAIQGGVGVDAEVVIDGDDRPWVVQARPLTRSLQPGFADFVAALVEAGDPLPGGAWALDAEHNPAPLSPAHEWLIRHVSWARPDRAIYRTLAGWLYARRSTAPDPTRPPPLAPRAALARLQRSAIPAARRRLAAFDAALAAADAGGLAELLPQAEATLLAALDEHAALAGPRPRPATGAVASPRCLVERRRFADVLPTAWDIAAPTLAEASPSMSLGEDPSAPDAPDDDDDAALLLGELDDHLFALGLAPWRRFYLRAAAVLEADPSAIFLITPPELRAALAAGALHPALDLPGRAAAAAARARLRPPLALRDGAPVPSPPSGRLRGVGIGGVTRGRLARRTGLTELLADPPGPEAIVALPTLTAQAALAVHDLGLRAVCTAHGGALSHGALIARELGLTALIGCRGCMDLADGAAVILDARAGVLRLALQQ